MSIFGTKRKHPQLNISEEIGNFNEGTFLSGENWQTKVEQLIEFKFKKCPKAEFPDYIRLLQAAFDKLEEHSTDLAINEIQKKTQTHLAKVASHYRNQNLNKNELIDDIGPLVKFGLTIAQQTSQGQKQRDHLFSIASQTLDRVTKIPRTSRFRCSGGSTAS